MVSLLFSPSGRVNRAKFWLGIIIQLVLVGVVMGVVFSSMGGVPTEGAENVDANALEHMSTGVLVVSGLLYIVLFWIGICLGIKRYHDRGKSGWWILIMLVPVIGGLWYFIETGFLKGTVGPNAYGADPLG